jgi:hypothetical protein
MLLSVRFGTNSAMIPLLVKGDGAAKAALAAERKFEKHFLRYLCYLLFKYSSTLL